MHAVETTSIAVAVTRPQPNLDLVFMYTVCRVLVRADQLEAPGLFEREAIRAGTEVGGQALALEAGLARVDHRVEVRRRFTSLADTA